MKLQAQQLNKESSQATMSSETSIPLQAKLPKLTITIFNGSYGDWPRFWGQYSENIDKTSVPLVTKFTRVVM